MANWVECTAAGESGDKVFINLEQAVAIREARPGSLVYYGGESGFFHIKEEPGYLLAFEAS